MSEEEISPSQVDEDSAPLDRLDRLCLARVEESLRRGLALRRWWEQTTGKWVVKLDHDGVERFLEEGPHPQSFKLLRDVEDLTPNYGFFDRLVIDGHEVPVMGTVQQTVLDELNFRWIEDALRRHSQLDEDSLEQIRRRILDFLSDSLGASALGNMRAEVHIHGPFIDKSRRPLEAYLQYLSWYPREPEEGGWGVKQLYYKRHDNGRVGKFRLVDRQPVNFQSLGTPYEWIVFSSLALDRTLKLRPVGARGPAIPMPLAVRRLGVLSRQFLRWDDDERDGRYRGRYGHGFAILTDPYETGLLAVQGVSVGFQLIDVLMKDDGVILARWVSVRDRPRYVMPLEVNPLIWGLELVDKVSLGAFSPSLSPMKNWFRTALPLTFDPFLAYVQMANLATAGMAAKELGISKDQLDWLYLVDVSIRRMRLLDAARFNWRRFLADQDLPEGSG